MWSKPIIPYIAPFALLLLLLSLGGHLPGGRYTVYPLLLLSGAILFALLWKRLPSLRPNRPLASVALGLAGAAAWILPYPWLTTVDPATERAYDAAFASGTWMFPALIAARLAVFVLITPFCEEIFWRGFLMRYLIREDFTEVKPATYTHFSFWGTTAAFVLVHASEWGVAIVFGILAGWWFLRTANLGNVILLHAITNLALGLYVIATRNWWMW